jgi:hypothetical protein
MKSKRDAAVAVIALAVAISGLTIGPSLLLAGPITTLARTTGTTAFALFLSTDASGCILTEVSVAAGSRVQTTIDAGNVTDPTVPSSQEVCCVPLFIAQSNTCSGELLFVGIGFMPEFPIENSVSPDVQSATLRGTIPVFDVFSPGQATLLFNASVDISWQATGQLFGRGGHFGSPPPLGQVIVVTFSGVTWEAIVSGTVSNGTLNYTPEPPIVTGITRTNEGQLELAITIP